MSPDDPDVVEEGTRESRTAQFYQAHDEAAHPLKEKYTADAKRLKYAVSVGHVSRDNPDPEPRLKVRLAGPSHTRLSARARPTNAADKQ